VSCANALRATASSSSQPTLLVLCAAARLRSDHIRWLLTKLGLRVVQCVPHHDPPCSGGIAAADGSVHAHPLPQEELREESNALEPEERLRFLSEMRARCPHHRATKTQPAFHGPPPPPLKLARRRARLRCAIFDRWRLASPFDRGRLGSACVARAELADDLGAMTAGVVDPLALPAGTRWVPVGARPGRVIGRAGLDDDSVTTRSGWSYTTTDITNEHSLAAGGSAVVRWLGPGDVERDTRFGKLRRSSSISLWVSIRRQGALRLPHSCAQ